MAGSKLNLLPDGFQLENDDQKFNQAADFTFGQESGYMVDKGRPTNYGIMQPTLDEFNKENGYPSMDVKDLTLDDAKFVLKKKFFDKPGINQLPQDTATVLFDYGVNSHPRTAIKALQTIVGTTPDGDLGTKTLKATQSFIDKNGEKALLHKIVDQRQQNYNRLLKNPSNQQWKNGWNNRIKKIKDTFSLAANATGQGMDALIGTGTANADEISPEEAAKLPDGFQVEDSNAQEPVTSPSPAQAASGAMAVRGLPVLGSLASGNPQDLANKYVDPSQLPPEFQLEDQIGGKTPDYQGPVEARQLSKYYDPMTSEEGKTNASSHVLDQSFKQGLYGHKLTDADRVLQEKHPVISAIGQGAGQLIGLAGVGSGVEPVVAQATKAAIAKGGLSLIPAITTAANVGKGGATFGIKTALDKLGKIFRGEQVTGQDLGDVAKSAAGGAAFGAANSVAAPLQRLTAQGLVGYGSAKLDGADDFNSAINGAVNVLFGLTNHTNYGIEFKQKAVDHLTDSLGSKLTEINNITASQGHAQAKSFIYNSAVKSTGINDPQLAMKKVLEDHHNSLDYFEALDNHIKAFTGVKKVAQGVQPIQGSAPARETTQPSVPPKSPIITAAEKHGTVVGIDASTKLPIIDTSKPVTPPASSATPTPESAPATPFVEKRNAVVEGAPKNRLSDWTQVIDNYADKDKFTQISQLPVDDTIKGRLLVHYNLKDSFPTPKLEVQPTKTAIVYQGRGKTPEEIYTHTQYPVAGQGQYFAFNTKDAANYGDVIKQHKVDTSKMLEVSTDEQWRALANQAGNKYTNPIGLKEEDVKIWADNVKKAVQTQGYDGLIVKISKNGDEGKRLREVFGHNQIVSYKSEASNVQIPKTEEKITQSPEGQTTIKTVGTDAGGVSNAQTNADKVKLPPHLQEIVDRIDGVKKTDVTPKGYGPDPNLRNDQVKFVKPATTPTELGQRIDQLNKFAQANAILRRNANMKQALGSFQGRGGKDAGKPGLIKLDNKTLLSDSDYVTTMAHELGHAIEHAVVGKTGNVKLKVFGDNIDKAKLKTMYNELFAVTEAVAPGGLKDKPEYYAKPAELIARFLEKMITAPSDLEKIAPTVMKAFEEQAAKHPIIDEFLKVAQDKLYNKKDLPKGQILPDLRETYQKQLNSKRLGNIAYGNYVSYRAMRERGKITIEQFMKERFKGVKDKPEDLFTAAEGIKVSRSGVPEFGTRSYNVARTPEEEKSLTDASWVKMPDPIWEGAKAYPQFSKYNTMPEDAKVAFDKLSPEGKKIILDFTAQRSEAKDYFNREMIQSANNIDRTIEGWVHHFWAGESSSTAVGGDRFRTKIAGTRKQRMGAAGYVKDLNQAITKAMTDLDGEKVWNDFIGRHLAMVTRPLAEGQQPMKGWIEVHGDLKKGIGRPVERQKTVIMDKSTGESFPVKTSRYQMPKEIYRHYELIKDLADEASMPLKIVNYLQQYWQINTLFQAGTATTNFIGGSIFFSNKVLHDMYLEGLTGEFKMPQTRANIAAMFKVLMPHGWSKAPDWVYGSDLSNFYGQFMTKGIDPVQHGIDKVADKALIGFGTIERYWKKVIMTSEGLSDINKLGHITKEGLKLPIKEEREMLAAINDTVDLYALDYDNINGALEQFRRNPVARGFKPYATYPYKYMKHIERLIRSIFDRSRPWQDRMATLMALSTLMGGYAYWSSKRKEQQQTPEAQVESKIPARLQTRGRTFVGTTDDGKELFTRFGKYPYFGLSETGVQLVNGNMEAGRDALNDVVGSLGPFANLTLLAFGYRNKYNQYDPVPVVVGDVAGGYLPAYRVMNDISRYFDPFQRKQQTFGQAAFGRYIPTTDTDLQEALHGKIRTEDVPVEGDIKGAQGHKTTIEYKLENNKEDILLSALSGIYRSRLDPAIVQAYIIREEKNRIKREKKLNNK